MDEKSVTGGGWWTLPQALVWIVTRREARVLEASGATAFDEVIRRNLAPNFSSKDPPIPAEAALHELKRAASKNQISIIGRRWGTEEAKQVPVDDSSVLGDRRGRAIVGTPSSYRDGDYWTHLVVRPAECKARWPIEPPRIIDPATHTILPPPPPRMPRFGASFVDRPTSASPRAATYAPKETYSRERVPEEFKTWARDQHKAGIIITADLAEDAMRGPKNNAGRRTAGLLVEGTGLSRETIRAWVRTLDAEWVAKQGVPPARSGRP
jgi:hypothetical protein